MEKATLGVTTFWWVSVIDSFLCYFQNCIIIKMELCNIRKRKNIWFLLLTFLLSPLLTTWVLLKFSTSIHICYIFQISSHTHSFIVSAYLDLIVWYIRFMYRAWGKESHQSYGFTAKSWRLFTYHLDRTIFAPTCVIIYRATGHCYFWVHVRDHDSHAGWVSSFLPAH